MFEHIKKEVAKDNAKNLKNIIDYIKKGNVERYLTALKVRQLKDGSITYKKAEELAIKKATKEANQRLAKDLKKIEAVEDANIPNNITVSIEWRKSSVWGYNPTATVWGSEYTGGYASGCGYDKESAAAAEALNAQYGILKALYNLEEKRLKRAKSKRPSRRDFIGYGSGYGVIPYFEGGVGESCHVDILKKLGFECVASHGESYDCYTYTAKKGSK